MAILIVVTRQYASKTINYDTEIKTFQFEPEVSVINTLTAESVFPSHCQAKNIMASTHCQANLTWFHSFCFRYIFEVRNVTSWKPYMFFISISRLVFWVNQKVLRVYSYIGIREKKFLPHCQTTSILVVNLTPLPRCEYTEKRIYKVTIALQACL